MIYSSTMDVVRAVHDYVEKMVDSVSGMKILLMDDETTAFVSVVFTQTQILQKEVYLVDKIENKARESAKHLKAICFLRPSADSVMHLVDELRNPKYSEYYLCTFPLMVSAKLIELSPRFFEYFAQGLRRTSCRRGFPGSSSSASGILWRLCCRQ